MKTLQNDFIVISHNCWGAEIYRELKKPYNTPFVGLFVPTECFIKLCENLSFYLAQDLNFITASKYDFYNQFRAQRNSYYPIGLLGDVEIHFMHYASEQEAQEKWSRRVARMHNNYDQYFLELSEREIFDVEDIYRFDRLPFKNKVFLSAKKYPEVQSVIQLNEFEKAGEVMDGKALYQITKYYFDPIIWVRKEKKKLRLFFYVKGILRKFKHEKS